MIKPVLILDPDWRRMDELFSDAARHRLFEEYDVIWGRDGRIPKDVLAEALPRAEVLIAAMPCVTADTLKLAPNLHTIIEVSGAFPDTINYAACFEANIEVLSCAPGFRRAVAEMGLAMALAGARGLVDEHEAFRRGDEHWLSDRPGIDFSLYGADVGFVGFGQIAQELSRLMEPFQPRVRAYDPWLASSAAIALGAELVPLDEVLSQSQCLFVTAAPTSENYHLLNSERLGMLKSNALLVVLSRAHLIDFSALEAELASGRIRACIDVFPVEPLMPDASIRQAQSTILSPHRAAAVDKGRQLIGDLILSDLKAIKARDPKRKLSLANRNTISELAGVGDAQSL